MRSGAELQMNSESRENSPSQNSAPHGRLRHLVSLSYPKVFLLLFVVSLPFVNPWIHGDGVGYYAYLHSPLIDHNLQFENEWQAGNASFTMGRLGPHGEVLASQYTSTHHIDNHFSVGPAILWAPFVGTVHFVLVCLDHFGANFSLSGFSRPYLLAMALSTALYGFLGLWLSFCLARHYISEKWAFLATVGYWFASPLPVYMYLNPSWSHAHSLFSVALFLWYWHRTRGRRTAFQWVVLGLLAALMANVYYLNVILLLVPGCEAIAQYVDAIRTGPESQQSGWRKSVPNLLSFHLLLGLIFVIGMLPTLITKKIIYGGFFTTGYPGASDWLWARPVLFKVLFSSDHGLLSWTPILILAILGIAMFRRLDRPHAFSLWITLVSFYYVIACYENWDGLASFGNRFFISLGPIFILGLAAFFERINDLWRNESKAFVAGALAVSIFIAWNIGFIFQWGDHLIPVRGPISWRTMTYNQFCVVPGEVWDSARAYLFSRNRFLHKIEQRDIQEIQKENPTNPNP